MKYNTCPKCKTKITADLAECPECGSHFSDSMQEHSTPREKSRVAMLPTVIAGDLIVIMPLAANWMPMALQHMLEIKLLR